MLIEEKLPGIFRRIAFHPSHFVYAWKRKDLEKLFDELLKGNIAILKVEVWIREGKEITSIIPLKTGDIKEFHWNNSRIKNEDFYDFTERSIKDTAGLINGWDLEKNVRLDKRETIWYNFDFGQEVVK